jgi:hypothetical protein
VLEGLVLLVVGHAEHAQPRLQGLMPLRKHDEPEKGAWLIGIAFTSVAEDHWFESRQGESFLGLYTMQCFFKQNSIFLYFQAGSFRH